jgi:hypothetical protein
MKERVNMNVNYVAAPLPERNYLPPSTSYGTPDLTSISGPSQQPSQSYGAPSTSYDPPAAGL